MTRPDLERGPSRERRLPSPRRSPREAAARPAPEPAAEQGPGGARQRRLVAARSRRRRNMAIVGVLLAVVLGFGAVDLARGGEGLLLDDGAPGAAALGGASPAPSAAPQESPNAPVKAPGKGSEIFAYAGGGGTVSGRKGTVLRYRVAVEQDTEVDSGEFADAVEAILGDARGWTGDGRRRFQRVSQSATTDFTVYLASAGTTRSMCAAGGLHTDGFLSCRLSGKIIINADRWAGAVPGYEPLEEYRAFAVNHELGHQLGFGHELCVGAGRPAPVMAQQSTGLHGCTPYGWPFKDGELYEGLPMP